MQRMEHHQQIVSLLLFRYNVLQFPSACAYILSCYFSFFVRSYTTMLSEG